MFFFVVYRASIESVSMSSQESKVRPDIDNVNSNDLEYT